MSRRLSRRALAAIVALSAIATLLVVPAPQPTRAAFTDSDHAAGAVTALRLQPPLLTTPVATCRRPTLGGDVLVVQWQWPATTSPYPLASSSAVWSLNGTVAATQPSTTGPTAGTYSTRFSTTLLSGLLGGLFGGSYSVEVRTRWTTPGGQVWSSPTTSRVNVTVPPLVGAPTCTVTNGT